MLLQCCMIKKGRGKNFQMCIRDRTLSELASKVDITLANLSVLKTGRARAIRFSTLDRLCRALDCQPGDLLAYVPGETET